MMLQIIMAFAAILAAGSIHFGLLRYAHRSAIAMPVPDMARFLLVLFAATIGQILAATIFAVTFWLSQEAGLGGLKDTSPDDGMAIFYFSLVNLTTLGLGDVIPLGHLKFLAAIEAMTGFLLISCSASHIFQLMQRKDNSDG